jgi:hypothetical protein
VLALKYFQSMAFEQANAEAVNVQAAIRKDTAGRAEAVREFQPSFFEL